MTDSNVFNLSQPGTFSDPLTEVLRGGARVLLAQAVEAEVAAFLGNHADQRTADGVGAVSQSPFRKELWGVDGKTACRTFKRELWPRRAKRPTAIARQVVAEFG